VLAAQPLVLLSKPVLLIWFALETTCAVALPVSPAVSSAVTVSRKVPLFV